jgi:hypothetical protein
MYPYNYEPSFRIGVVKSWNSITGTFEDSINQIDKTLHTNTINLPEGLTLNWSDLNPSNSVNLIKNQFYTQVISYGIVSDGYEGDIPFDFFYTLRPIKIVNINITLNSSGQFLIPGAPTSNTPDNMFWAIESTDTYIYKLKINNIDVANILSQSSTLSPAPGQLKVLNSSSGIIQYNTSDSGKVLTGTMSYYCKIHTTEV